MKKLLTFLTLLFLILLFPFEISAHDFGIDQEDGFEALVGKTKEELINYGFINKMKKIEEAGYLNDGYLIYFREVRNKSVEFKYDARLYFSNSKVTKYEIYVDNDIKYRIKLTDNGFDLLNTLRIDYYSKYNDSFTAGASGYTFNGDYNTGYNRQSLKNINSDIVAVGFNAVNVLKVEKLNDFEVTTYLGNLKDYSGANNFSVSGVKNQKILDTDYDLTRNITEGKYYIYSSGVLDDKIVYQKMIINVCKPQTTTPTTTSTTTPVVEPTTTITSTTSSTAPAITTTASLKIDDYVVGYRDNLERDKYIAYLKNKYDLDVTSVKSSYFDNQNKIGKHNVEIEAPDASYNSIIQVIDNIAPIIIGNNVTISSQTKFSLDEFRNRLTAVDEIDGAISCKNIKINDLDGYLNNPNKSGVYKVEATVSDLSGNTCKSVFEIYVTDNNSYGVYIENATIIITNSSVATEGDLISFLKKNGLITTNNVKLSSAYFDSTEPKGEYNLEVSENDNKNTFLIHVQDLNSNQKNEEKNVDNKKDDNFIIYIIIGVSSAIILIIILVYVFVKKKH